MGIGRGVYGSVVFGVALTLVDMCGLVAIVDATASGLKEVGINHPDPIGSKKSIVDALDGEPFFIRNNAPKEFLTGVTQKNQKGRDKPPLHLLPFVCLSSTSLTFLDRASIVKGFWM